MHYTSLETFIETQLHSNGFENREEDAYKPSGYSIQTVQFSPANATLDAIHVIPIMTDVKNLEIFRSMAFVGQPTLHQLRRSIGH